MERGLRTAVTCDGRPFHRRAAATGNALSQTVDGRVRRTSRDIDEAARIVVISLECLLIDVGEKRYYVHTVRSCDDPAVTDDAATTLMTPALTTMCQTHEPWPRVWHSLCTADNTVKHQRTDIRHSTVAA